MSDCSDTQTFDSIAPELGAVLIRLGEAITASEALALRDRASALLVGASSSWPDLAERMVTPRQATQVLATDASVPPPPPPAGSWPTSDIKLDQDRMLTNAELGAYGYRSRSQAASGEVGYGYESTPVPDPDAARAG